MLRLEYSYDGAGLPYQFTSYDAVSSGSVVNQVRREYNPFGQLKIEYQENDGSVNTSTSGKVQYAYSHDSDQDVQHSRMTSMTYPDTRQLDYAYGSGTDANVSRLSSQKWSSEGTALEQYEYLGADRIVGRVRPESDTQMRLFHYNLTGDPPDYWFGLDRYARVADLTWEKASDGTDLDSFQYGYDIDDNVLFKKNSLAADKSELYHADGATAGYDSLDRLAEFQRGTLSDANTDGVLDTASSHSRRLEWSLDTLGNWSSLTTDGTSASRSHNKQNQLTNTNFTHDANGNLTQDGGQNDYAYDAWNRLVGYAGSVSLGGPTYEYDALGRRISELNTLSADPKPTVHLYYSQNWQVILEQTVTPNLGGENLGGGGSGGGEGDGFSLNAFTPANTVISNRYAYVWSPDYIDSMVTRERDGNADSDYTDAGERLYVQQDANRNATSVVAKNGSGDWGVRERYIYDPYGAFTVLNGASGFDADTTGGTTEWSNDAGSSDVTWKYLHQGGRYDSGTASTTSACGSTVRRLDGGCSRIRLVILMWSNRWRFIPAHSTRDAPLSWSLRMHCISLATQRRMSLRCASLPTG